MATAATEAPSPADVSTTLDYYEAADEGAPYKYVHAPPPGKARSNVGVKSYPALIHDLRGKEDKFRLDEAGFQFVPHKSVEKDFLDEKKVKDVYYKEVEELVKRETGAKRVFVFGYLIRRNYDKDPEDGQAKEIRAPVQQVHVDQTPKGAIQRVRDHLGDDADRLLRGRVRIINVWRPISTPVAHNPLAVSNYRTLNPPQDFVPAQVIYPDRVGELYAVKYNPNLQWYYLKGQTPEEFTFIKCFDSDESKARLTPHSAFEDPTDPSSAPKRQSIEVRTLVSDEE